MTRLIEGEIVILDREGGKVHQLNPVASCIWNSCDGSSSVDSIAERLVASFDVAPEKALRDVEALLQELQGLGLLHIGHK
ncbi:MAG TPA: PqqD family protein [Sulfuricaulis sp.]|nr:PqqD family protein [Sulfuricaulis sp.]